MSLCNGRMANMEILFKRVQLPSVVAYFLSRISAYIAGSLSKVGQFIGFMTMIASK